MTAAAVLSTYARALTQRNSLLKRIREEAAGRTELAYWDGVLVRERRPHPRLAPRRRSRRWRHRWPPPTARSRPTSRSLTLRYVSNVDAARRRGPQRGPAPAPARDRRQGDLERRHAGGAPPRRHRLRGGRPRPTRSSRHAGQQRTAILALKLAELDLLSELDGRPPAAAPRRRLQRARPGAARAPRAAHREPAPGHRDDDHGRRPRPGPGGGLEPLAGGARRGSPGAPRGARGGPASARPAPRADARGLGREAARGGGPRSASASCCRAWPPGSASTRSCEAARAMSAWRRVVEEHAPAAGASPSHRDPAAGARRLGRRRRQRPGAAPLLRRPARRLRPGARRRPPPGAQGGRASAPRGPSEQPR